MERPVFITFLRVWQIIESLGLLFAIPLTFIFGILLTGDSYTTFDFVTSNIIPVLVGLLLIKIVITIALFKNIRWAVFVNLVQNSLLLLVSLVLILASYFNSIPLSFGYYFFILVYGLLTVGFYQCVKHPYFKQKKRKAQLQDTTNQTAT
ncbi:MAG: hypothetical protein KOO66_12165 [Bacteroidales bacterium]|nr:hypothetical protein [Bacteroidales bacterium]